MRKRSNKELAMYLHDRAMSHGENDRAADLSGYIGDKGPVSSGLVDKPDDTPKPVADTRNVVIDDYRNIYDPPYYEAINADRSITETKRAEYMADLEKHERTSDSEMDAYTPRVRKRRYKK